MVRISRWASVGFLGSILTLIVGCGSSGVTPSGTVEFNGKPLPGAELEFKLTEGDDLYLASSDDDGKFQVTQIGGGGIPAGTYEVTVTFWTNKEGEFPPLTEEAEALKEQGVFFQVSGTSRQEITAENSTVSISFDRESVSRVSSDE